MKRAEMIMFIRTHPNTKITHPLFDSDEYIYFSENGFVYDERGSLFENWSNARWSRDGIRSRADSKWEDGWEVKEEQGAGEKGNQAQAQRVSMAAYNSLRDMFIDFVCSGIHNPAPYCENVSEKCVNCYGWCKQDDDECRGFSPRVKRKGNI